MKKTKKPTIHVNSQWLCVSQNSLSLSATVIQAARRPRTYRSNRLARWRTRNLRSGCEVEVLSGLDVSCWRTTKVSSFHSDIVSEKSG
jgi:hypothetical protein